MKNSIFERFEVNLLQFDLYERKKPKSQSHSIGRAFILIKDGLINHYVDCPLFENQLDKDGQPILEKLDVRVYEDFDLESAVTACLWELRRLNFFSKKLNVVNIYTGDFQTNLIVKNWFEGWEEPKLPVDEDFEAKVASLLNPKMTKEKRLVLERFIKKLRRRETQKLRAKQLFNGDDIFDKRLGFYVETELSKVEGRGDYYSQIWYLLKICFLYFQSPELSRNRVAKIGKLFEQMTLKFEFEPLIRGSLNSAEGRRKAQSSKKRNSEMKSQARELLLVKMWKKAVEDDPYRASTNSGAAHLIRDKAIITKPLELMRGGKVISTGTISRDLGKLRKSGKLC